MEILPTAINKIVWPVDISETFEEGSIHKADNKYFRFWHNNHQYQIKVLVMGLNSSRKKIPQIVRLVSFPHLRALSHINTAFIDDSCLQGSSYQSSLNNIKDTVKFMNFIGAHSTPLTIGIDTMSPKGNIVAKYARHKSFSQRDMHIGDMLLAISGQYLDILSSLVTLTLQIST
jgi:hypothetical protein